MLTQPNQTNLMQQNCLIVKENQICGNLFYVLYVHSTSYYFNSLFDLLKISKNESLINIHSMCLTLAL